MSRLCNNKPDEAFSFSARSQFRRAQLHAKRNAEAAKRKERELLFEGIREGKEPVGSFGRRKGGQEKLSQDELLLNATNDVTAALRETHSLMQVEVSRSQFAHETLRKNSMPKQKLTSSLFKPKAYVQRTINGRTLNSVGKLRQPRQPSILLPFPHLQFTIFSEIRHLVSRKCLLHPCLHNRVAFLPPHHLWSRLVASLSAH